MMSTPFGPRPPVSGPADSDPTPPAANPAEPVDASVGVQGTDPASTDAATQEPPVILNPQPAWTGEAEAVTSEADRPWWNPEVFQGGGKSLLGPMLLAFGVLLMVTIMMRHLRRKSMNRPAPQPIENRIASIHERAASSIGPVERTMSDAEELARRLSATMENKAARLELLIDESERKLEELNRAIAQVSRATPVSSERAGRPLRSIDPSVLDRARVEQDRAERNGHQQASSQAAPPARTAEAPPPPSDPVHRRVWALADDGMPTLEIARSLNQPIGQVELILNLRKSG